MKTIMRALVFVCGCLSARAGAIYNVTLDTSPLVGHPAGPFYFEVTFTDGSGVADGNNTVSIGNLDFGGGSSLGDPILFGGASGSLESGITITDSSVLTFFSEQFSPGLHLSFSLGLTGNDDAGGTPDGFTFFLLDSSGVPLPTLAPFGDYFLAADLGSDGPVLASFGSDPSRSPTDGGPVTIGAPDITAANPVPEPSTIYLLGGGLAAALLKRLGSRAKGATP